MVTWAKAVSGGKSQAADGMGAAEAARRREKAEGGRSGSGK